MMLDPVGHHEVQERRLPPSRLVRGVTAVVRFTIGVFLCPGILGAIAVLGWTMRWMRRVATKTWWAAAGQNPDRPEFIDFARGDWQTAELAEWPRCFLSSTLRNPADGVIAKAREWLRYLFGGAAANFRSGISAVFTTLAFSLPAGLLMLFSWYDGWNNSFNKGYEQAAVGPFTGFAGMAIAAIAAMYLPIALARQSTTGNWRTAFRFRANWRITRIRPLSALLLALVFVAASFPLTVLNALTVAPEFVDKLATKSPSEQMKSLQAIHLGVAVYLLPAFLLVHALAARVYAKNLLLAVRRGIFTEDDLTEHEWQVLQRLDLLRPEPARNLHPAVAVARWGFAKIARGLLLPATFLLWFLPFYGQIYTQQFFRYDATAWLNHRLLHVPWVGAYPIHLRNGWWEMVIALLVIVGGAALLRMFRKSSAVVRGWRSS